MQLDSLSRLSSEVALGLGVVGVLVLFALVLVPRVQTRNVEDLATQIELKNKIRGTIAQILGGAILLAGIFFTWEEMKSSRQQFQETFELSQERQITERFTRAIEQLGASDGSGSRKIETRLGAIYSLERIARDSETDHWSVMEILTAYVRMNARVRRNASSEHEIDPRPPLDARSVIAVDVQAALTVLGRRIRDEAREQGRTLDISNSDLYGAVLLGADLAGANLSGTILDDSSLGGTRLFLDIRMRRLEERHEPANFEGARLLKASLRRAYLLGVNLRNADLGNADLTNAYLIGADLEGANLSFANLTEARLREARLFGTKLNGVKGLAEQWLLGAYWDESTVWPRGFIPPCPVSQPENPCLR